MLAADGDAAAPALAPHGLVTLASLVEAEAQNMARRMAGELQQQGMKAEDMKLGPELFRASAEERVKLGLALGEVVRTHALEAKPEQVKALSKTYQNAPKEILLDTDTRSEHIEQLFFEVAHTRKNDALLQLLGQLQPEQALVFCNTKIDCQNVEQHLIKAGFDACALHGDMEQRDRDEALGHDRHARLDLVVADLVEATHDAEHPVGHVALAHGAEPAKPLPFEFINAGNKLLKSQILCNQVINLDLIRYYQIWIDS